jgi:hypothetical protein
LTHFSIPFASSFALTLWLRWEPLQNSTIEFAYSDSNSLNRNKAFDDAFSNETMTPVILILAHHFIGPTISIKIHLNKIWRNKLPPKNANFEWAFERENGVFEKTLNKPFTLPNDGYDVITSLLFSLNRHIVSHNHHDSHFFCTHKPRVKVRSLKRKAFLNFPLAFSQNF